MIDPMQFYGEGSVRPSRTSEGKFRVTNLIDWNECNMCEELSTRPGSPEIPSCEVTRDCSPPAAFLERQDLEGADGREAMRAEIEDLKLMLATANEEKHIQTEILTEEKHRIIDDLSSRLEQRIVAEAELQAENAILREQLRQATGGPGHPTPELQRPVLCEESPLRPEESPQALEAKIAESQRLLSELRAEALSAQALLSAGRSRVALPAWRPACGLAEASGQLEDLWKVVS